MVEVAGVGLLITLAAVAAFLIGRRSTVERPEAPDPSRSLWGRINRLESEQKRAAEVIEGMTEGVLVLSASLTPVLANASARRLLTLPGGELPPTIPSDEVTSTARRCISENAVIESDLNWSAAGLSLRVRAVPLEQDGCVVFLHDITEELRTQQLRRQFVANASHELKTPVASLRALVEAIGGAVTEDPAAAARFAEQMNKEGQRMAALIDDLMDLSRVEDPAAMHLGEADFSKIVAEETAQANERASASEIRIEVDIEPELRIRGDDQHLKLMVRNLIENAIRYTPKGGQVGVSLERADGWARLQVSDTGIGIPLQAQGRVFERFYRVDEDRARLSGGTGLGLSIVKNVAESHAGAVAVTSELDEGSTFTVTLPLLDGDS
jgi:two-component system sensor histidine kinase SenX3